MKVNDVTKKMRVLIITFCMIFGLGFVVNPMTTYAASEGTGNDYDISWIGGAGNGAFSEMEKTVQETGNSAFNLFMAIGVVGLLLSLIICGLGIAFAGGGQNRSQKLGWLLWIGIGGIVIFGATSIIAILQNIGVNII